MRPPPAVRTTPQRVHPALRSFAAECRDTLLGVLAYAGVLALIGLAVIYAAAPLTDAAISAVRDGPAIRIDLAGISTPEILRHTDDGRKDNPGSAAVGQAGSAPAKLGLRGAL